MQRRFKLDKTTVKKILKSLYLAVLPAIAVAGISFLEAVTVQEGVQAAVWAYIVPILINDIKEWVAGQK